MKKALKTAGWILVMLILLTPLVCWSLGIRFFAVGVKTSRFVDRVDRLDGFYVAVYTHNVYTTTDEEGNTNVHFGSDMNVTDCGWKHEETSSITPYKRFLFFSRETEAESYVLMSEDGEYCYGAFYVLRARNGKIHYYYIRYAVGTGFKLSRELIEAETIAFSYGGEEIPLIDYTRFSSRVDFTTGDKILLINGIPCRFSSS